LKRETTHDLIHQFSAVLGVSKDIEAINGKVRIKLEDGIQSGKILKGKGIPVSMVTSGDLLVHVNVWTPKP
jgi:molecular chaperone DnaJ